MNEVQVIVQRLMDAAYERDWPTVISTIRQMQTSGSRLQRRLYMERWLDGHPRAKHVHEWWADAQRRRDASASDNCARTRSRQMDLMMRIAMQERIGRWCR